MATVYVVGKRYTKLNLDPLQIEDIDLDALWAKWIEEVSPHDGFTRIKFCHWCFENCFYKVQDGRVAVSSLVVEEILDLWTAMGLISKGKGGYLIASQYLPNSNSPDADK